MEKRIEKNSKKNYHFHKTLDKNGLDGGSE
jgi:hypothetical protein